MATSNVVFPLKPQPVSAATTTALATGTIRPYNASAGALAPVLPALSTVVDDDYLIVEKDSQDTSANAVTVTCAGSDAFFSGVTSVALTVKGERVEIQAATVGGSRVWKVKHHTIPKAGLDSIYAALPTSKRITLPLSDGSANWKTNLTEVAQRFLVRVPSTVTRYRIRASNYSPKLEAAGTATLTCTGIWAGIPDFTHSSLYWDGWMTAAPTQVVQSFTATGTEYVSPWITPASPVGGAYGPLALSIGLAAGSGTTVQSATGCIAVYGSGASTTTAAAAAFTPPGGTILGSPFGEFRFEYETVTGERVGLYIGDSITAGITPGALAGSAIGCMPHEAWPGAASTQRSRPWINAGVGGSFASEWASGTSKWKWARLDLATTVPDFAVIAPGTNDLASGVTAATLLGYLQTTIAQVRALGISKIYAATIIPRAFGTSNEAQRISYNAQIGNIPFGLAGVLDLNKAVESAPTSAICDSDLVPSQTVGGSDQPHPNPRGYAVLGSFAATAA